MRVFIVVLLCALVGACAQTRETETAWEACRQKRDMAKRIAACTILIDDGKVTGRKLVRVLNKRGIGFERSGQNRRAIKDYNTALKLMPDYAIGLMNRGYAYNKLGQYRKGLRDLNASIALDAKEWLAFHHRGNANAALGRISRAIRDFDRSVALAPDQAAVLNINAYKFLALGKLKRAETAILGALSVRPQKAEYLDTAGDVYCRKKDFAQAVQFFEAAFLQKIELAIVKRRQMAKAGYVVNEPRTARDVEVFINSFTRWLRNGCPGVVADNLNWFPVKTRRR